VIGVAHAGWRGTVMGMAYNLIRAMVESYGCRPSDIQAGIGPSIGPECYQVGEEVVTQAGGYYGEDTLPALFKRDPSDGTAYFNLWEANKRDLMRAGVDAEQIEIAGLCTATRTDEFYSHRAEKGHTGRFGALIAL
jgi:copper oxidase (laccase) domain-containing protein